MSYGVKTCDIFPDRSASSKYYYKNPTKYESRSQSPNSVTQKAWERANNLFSNMADAVARVAQEELLINQFQWVEMFFCSFLSI